MSDEPNSALTDNEPEYVEAIGAERRKRRLAQLGLAAAVVFAACGVTFAVVQEAQKREQMRALEREAAELRAVEAEQVAREEREAAERVQRMRQSVHDSLVMASDARTPEEIRLARELLDEAVDLARLAAPDLLPEVERGRHFLALAAQRVSARTEVAPPPRAVKR